MASVISQIPSSSASFLTLPPTSWDIFLSFCGKDTRYNFTSHLYSALDRNGLRTFRDDPELHSGDVISDTLRRAIHESKTYIVVLSTNYASSTWCLDELVEIFNCHNTMQTSIIPVFYNIEPSIVRHQTGSFEKAFKKHELRFADERVSNWRHVLTEVANISGQHIHEKRSEADIVNEIVADILLVLNPAELPVAKYPVGLDSQVKCITSLLSSDTIGVIKFGIYGMGGVGKTTLAKALYNQLLHEGIYTGSCFLANVREVSELKGLESLQQQLIKDVLKSKEKVEVTNVDEGTKLIRARMSSKKVLVVIDDLQNPKQLDSLVGPFASGSVIVITTKDEEILDKIKVKARYRYRVNELKDAEALALFSQHAFGNTKPEDTLMVLSKDILLLAGGLPLALEVFGSYLYKRSVVGWKVYIENLQRSPNRSIQQRLITSLDALESDDPMLKKMFLDIACFFIGMKKKKVVEILETYYTYADYKIDNLKKRCLLTIDNKDELRMHDLLQDIGREIARNNSPNEPGKHSRLSVSKEICDVLKKHEGTEAIEGIMLYMEDEDPTKMKQKGTEANKSYMLFFEYEYPIKEVFSIEAFSRMSKLRFLCLKGINLTGNFDQKLEDLRWFCWEMCPLTCLPSKFCPQKLIILELPHSKMRALWELNMVSPVFENLKTLDLSFSQDLITTPDFSKLPCLTTLNLDGCKSLEEVHMSIGSLLRLVFLNLMYCVKLRSLPDTICNLRALKSLRINGCSSLEALPRELGDIGSLTEISAPYVNLRGLPDSLGRLSRLVRLGLGFSGNIITLPNTICDLRTLEVLDITGCDRLSALPKEIGNIKSLRYLYATRINVLKLPDSLGSLDKLVVLKLDSNYKLKTLPDTIGNLTSLEILDISQCRELEILPEQLWKLTRLKKLDASVTTRLKKLPSIESRQIALSLQKLSLTRSGVTALPSISQLTNLEYLSLFACHHLLSIEELSPNLKEIDAYDCNSLERLPNLSNLKQLERLNFIFCGGLTQIQGLEELTSLTQLHLGYCNSSLLACTLTKQLFQAYSGFGHEIEIWIGSEKFPDWIGQSTEDGPTMPLNLPPSDDSSAAESTMYLDLPPNVSHDYLGVIICYKGYNPSGYFVPDDFSKSMVIVPRSTFLVTKGHTRIKVTTNKWKQILRTTVLYKPEIAMTDKYNSTTFIDLKLVDPTLQDIFLDIACFFIGWKKEEVVKILETCYTSVSHKIDILRERYLLRTNNKDELEMHDFLQNFGRKIARNNYPNEPGKQSRLWLSADIVDVLKKRKGTEAIQGIIPRKLSYQDALQGESFTTETFKRMNKLRFLYFKNVILTGSFEKTLEDLRWLFWDGCPLKCLPSEFYPKKIVTLELPHSKLKSMWEPHKVSRVFEKLKTLNLSYSLDLTTTPDFTKLPCLETLNFECCESLEQIPIPIGCLERLVSLNLHGCKYLRSLGDSICTLRALRFLNIGGCSSLKGLPVDIGNLESLTELNAEGINVWELPYSIGSLSKLVKLILNDSPYLETLPNTICNLRALEVLSIKDCWSLEALPSELGKIESLTELKVCGLNIWELPDSIGNLSKLVKLTLSHNENLDILPDTICNLSSLEILDISMCENLEILPDQLWKLTRLKELDVSGTTRLTKLPDIELSKIALPLQKLNMFESGLTALPSGISQLSYIEELNLQECCDLLSIEEIPPNVKLINAYSCTSLERIQLPNLKQLEELDLTDCSGLAVIESLEELTSIRILHLGGWDSTSLTYTLTKCLFQMYSGFGHLVNIYAPEFPDWIGATADWNSQSPEGQSRHWTSSFSRAERSGMSLKLPQNVSHSVLGMILCFEGLENYKLNKIGYSLKNGTADFLSEGFFHKDDFEALMVVVPTSIFPIKDGEEIKLSSSYALTSKIYLLYRSEYESTTANVGDERSNPLISDMESNKNWLATYLLEAPLSM